jgi:hypothetical protein
VLSNTGTCRGTEIHSFSINQRRKLNTICSVIDAKGQVWRRKKEVSKPFIAYYTQLFSSQSPSGIADCLSSLEHRVTDE